MESRTTVTVSDTEDDSVTLPLPDVSLVEVNTETKQQPASRKCSWTAFFRSMSPIGLGVVEGSNNSSKSKR